MSPDNAFLAITIIRVVYPQNIQIHRSHSRSKALQETICYCFSDHEDIFGRRSNFEA